MIFDPIRNPSDVLAAEQGCHFDEAAGARVCEFVERFCLQSKGRWGGQPIVLLEWQRDLLMRLFGWKRADGFRRFRSCYVEIPKKNGKSTLASALTLYLAIADGEKAPEVYLNAVDREQAGIVFEEACRMVDSSPDLSRRLAVSRYHGTIVDPKGYGKIQRNSADAPSKDGVNASGMIFDEIHRFKNRGVWDIMRHAGISREQPLRFGITTAGEEAEGVWHEEREFSEKVNSGAIESTTHLGVVYRAMTEADEGGADDMDDPATWRKANPSMGHTMSEEDFASEYAEAKAKGGVEWANFLRLRLGIIMRAEGKFVDLAAWDRCAAAPIPNPDDPCWMGLDLSSNDDLTALVILTRDPDGVYDVQCRFWLPEDRIVDLERRHGLPYRMWAQEGLIDLIPGPVIDYGVVEQVVLELANGCNLTSILVDPWNAYDLTLRLLNTHGLPVVKIRQIYSHLTDATKRLGDLVAARSLRHGGQKILRLHASNAVAVQDGAGNIMLHKGKSRKKIDGIAALVNALAGAITVPEAESSVYETESLFVL